MTRSIAGPTATIRRLIASRSCAPAPRARAASGSSPPADRAAPGLGDDTFSTTTWCSGEAFRVKSFASLHPRSTKRRLPSNGPALRCGPATRYAHRRREMSNYRFARRSFLRAAGGSAVLLAPLLRSIESRAQGIPAPLRLLIIHHPLGATPGLATWRPDAAATTTDFTLPMESAPFSAAATPLQKYMVMIDGLNVVTPSGQNTH